MKHLKKYKLFESKDPADPIDKEKIEEILDYIEDIFLELKDEGFVLDYSGVLLTLTIYKSNPNTNMYGHSKAFKISEIAPTIKTMKNYLDSVNFTPLHIEVKESRGKRMFEYDQLDNNLDKDILNFQVSFFTEQQAKNGAKLCIAPADPRHG